MGLEVGAAIAVVGAVAKGAAQISSANLRRQALELESGQKKIEYQQKTLKNYDQVKKVVDAQTANAAALGYSGASLSLNALQRDVFQTGAETQQNFNIEQNIAQRSIDLEKQSVQTTLYAQLFGDAFGAAGDIVGLNAKASSAG
jgi:hypothetical protein